ncbi:Type III secretion cytoplasmic protein (YscL) [Pseudomonas orientalis]|uniref:type III secretion system stator protein SctL n=1 Tax=Pseudomonas orientalis TaxID=76758 RepID=UPI000F563581|nr:type III secretion system stator protein SctL [Pseudomonas orientalis]AZE82138.1 Type III secretion cytoplasmic protein (YscL) [Pseudomonas orientalis]
MLCRHKIELSMPSPCMLRSMIPREEIANWKQANLLLGNADAKAEELIRLTEKKCEMLLEKASLEIWQRANAQLQQWESERQAMCDNLEHYATLITNQTIRCLLDETVAPQRLAALVRQLLKNQIHEVSATLMCHPHDLEEMTRCLANHGATLWKLNADNSMRPQTLVLKTDEGDFRICWRELSDALCQQEKDYRIEV